MLAPERYHEDVQASELRKPSRAVFEASRPSSSIGFVFVGSLADDLLGPQGAAERRIPAASRPSGGSANASSPKNKCSPDQVSHEDSFVHPLESKRQQLPIGLRGCEHFDWLELRQRLLHLRQLGLRECQRQDEVSHVRGFTADPFPQDLVHDLVAKISDDRICNRSLRRVDVKATSPGITVSLEVARQSIRESIDRPLDSVSQMQARVEADATRDQAVAPSTSARRKMRGVRAMRRMRSMRMMRVMSRA